MKSVIDYGIKIEEYSYKLYSNAARKTKVESQKTLLRQLADQELLHKARLKGASVRIGNLDIVPAELALTPLNEFGSMGKLLDFAVRLEQGTKDLYAGIAKRTSGEVKELFNWLATEEGKHERILIGLQESLGLS